MVKSERTNFDYEDVVFILDKNVGIYNFGSVSSELYLFIKALQHKC